MGAPWGTGHAVLYDDLSQLFQKNHGSPTPGAILNCCQRHGLQREVIVSVEKAEDANKALYEVLRGDGRLHRLQHELQQEPCFLTEIADSLFPDLEVEAAQEATIQLVNLALRARPDGDSLPLLPARYHVFARALEGAFVCLHTEGHADAEPRLFLTRHEECPECGKQVFEMATCARCGIAYVVAEEVVETRSGQRAPYLCIPKGGYGAEERPLRYFILADDLPDANEDELIEESSERDDWPVYTICRCCGQRAEQGEQLTCSCRTPLHVSMAPFDGTEQDRMYCPLCASRSRGGGVYRFLTGQDAPVSVLSTALYTELPRDPTEEMESKPGQGRKLLIFADSRQDAAFFAPYLERTYNNVLRRRLIFQSLQQDDAARRGGVDAGRSG